jgi:3D (Asp-Asp-Asp) domain-containing protein
MLSTKRRVKLRYIKILRLSAIILGFWFAIHITHRECAKMADKPLHGNILQESDDRPNPPSTLSEEFQATAYCITGVSRSGTPIKPGHVAADPNIIPLGSMIYVDSPSMGGIYQVKDTGDLIKGKIIDIFIPSYERCKEFGRRAVKVQVLRYGFLGYRPESEDKK